MTTDTDTAPDSTPPDVAPAEGPALDSNPAADFLAMLDAADQPANAPDPKPGMSLTGKIVEINPEQGLVLNLGLKHDGLLPKEALEQLLAQGKTFEVGQTLQVTVTSVADKDSYILVAIPQPNKFQQDWEAAQNLLDSKAMWEGTVTGYNKGGLIVKFGNLQAFVPTSHLASLPRDEKAMERTAGLANWVGRVLGFKVIEVDAQRRRLVLSQREAQKEFKTKLRAKIFSELAEGQVRTGVVTGLRDFGAFVDLGGADGLIHVSEISWQRVKHPGEVLKVGQTVEVEVVKIDTTSQRVGLSLKRRQADPWSMVAERLQVGQVVEGRVLRLTPFGAFVELGEGVDGLIHISRLADQPQLTEGDNVSVRVLSIDPSRQRIGLALVDPFQEQFGDSAE